MNRRRLATWLLFLVISLPAAGTTVDDVPEPERQQILTRLTAEVPPARLRNAKVFRAADLAAVRLLRPSGPAVWVLERSGGDIEEWTVVARITAADEDHFGDAVLLSPSAILVAAPETAGSGLGPGATYVFQRNVGGKNHWGLVAKLALGDYPPPGTVTVQQLSESRPVAPTTGSGVVPLPPVAAEAPPPATAPEPAVVPPPAVPTVTSLPVASPPPVVASSPPPVAPPPPAVGASPPPPVVPSPRPVEASPPPPVAPPPPAVPPPPVVVAPPPAEAGDTSVVGEAVAESSERRESVVVAPTDDDRPPVGDGELRYIAVASMRELPHALAFATTLQECGYPSEVHRNHRGFFVVTLARLPLAEAKRQRAKAVADGDIPREAYLIVGSSFEERISP